MQLYKENIRNEVRAWQKQMIAKPTLLNSLAKKMQTKINTWIPEKVHQAITVTIKQMVRAVLFGAKYTTQNPVKENDVQLMEVRISERIKLYRNTAAVEGGITGAGGLLLGLADFPLLLGLKLKFGTFITMCQETCRHRLL